MGGALGMYAKQITALIELKKGRLVDLTKLLGDNGIDLVALSLADNVDFMMVRAIVSDPEKALQVLQHSGYTAKQNDVLAVAVSDTPGGLATALETLKENDITILYMYSLVRRVGEKAVIIFRVEEQEKALQKLQEAGVELFCQQQLISDK